MTVTAESLVRGRPSRRRTGALSDRGRLFLLSFLLLFLELALIRWTGSNVVYLSYFSNFVLLGSFLGIGVGFLRARAKPGLFPWVPMALAFFIAFIRIFPVEIDRSGSELIYFGSFERTGLPMWVTLPLIFAAVALIMSMVAQGLAQVFSRFEALEAYRLDIMGSIAGIAAFSILSFLGAPPLAWGLVAGGTFAVLYGRAITLAQVVAILAIIVMLGRESLEASWSPYYKVTVNRQESSERIHINVNGIPHQSIAATERRVREEPIYSLPYDRLRASPLDDVLIIGSGNGSDVAIALSEGAGRIDAVEIDPRIFQIGRDLHPDRPYDDPRVDVHIDDGRAFLERTTRRYDLILFALPDSLTLVSGQSALRLESYLFTREAMQEARRHLKPDGVFGMYNFYRERWLIDRLAGTLQDVYGRPPCVDQFGTSKGIALLTAGVDQSAVRCVATWSPARDAVPEPVTDDYPFLYLRTRGIPGFYLSTIGLILLASLILIKAGGGLSRRIAGYGDLFFMGAAFLLLETKSVVQFALLFGTTWFVNALVFAGVLLSVLAAIEVARRVRFRRPARVYGALLGSLAVAWFVPPKALLALPVGPRFVTAVIVSFTPIFLANLVFAQRFRDVGSSTLAFGANLLGAMVGGLLENTAMLTGYQALLFVAAAFYGLAFAAGRRHLSPVGTRVTGPAP